MLLDRACFFIYDNYCFSMVSNFEGFLAEYAQHSAQINGIEEGDFSKFDMSQGDSVLHWDKNRHVGVMNRHNYALLFWLDYFVSTGEKPILVHVDGHQDLAEPSQYLSKADVKQIDHVAKYVDNIEVKEFIKPAAKLGLVKEIELFGSENTFENFENAINLARDRRVIFDLDLDVYTTSPFVVEEYNSEAQRERGISYRDSYESFAELMHLSDLTTVAFSPDYLRGNENEVVRHFRNIRSEYDEVSSKGLFGKVRKFF